MFALLAITRRGHRHAVAEANGIPSSGTATFLTTVNVRTAASTSSTVVATYSAGQTVNYDSTVTNEGRTWISYIGGSGNRRYCCAIDTNGAQYVSVGGSSSGGSSSGCPRSKGIPYYQRQSSYAAVRGWGCLFCSCCFLGGLNTISEVDTCFAWASGCGKVRSSDSYVNVESYGLAKQIASRYGRCYSDYKIVHGSGHFYVTDWSGNEIYNSAGWGWGH